MRRGNRVRPQVLNPAPLIPVAGKGIAPGFARRGLQVLPMPERLVRSMLCLNIGGSRRMMMPKGCGQQWDNPGPVNRKECIWERHHRAASEWAPNPRGRHLAKLSNGGDRSYPRTRRSVTNAEYPPASIVIARRSRAGNANLPHRAEIHEQNNCCAVWSKHLPDQQSED